MATFGGYTLLTYEQAKELGIKCKKPKQKMKCEFCGEDIQFKGFAVDGKIDVFYPISCRCPEAVAVRTQTERKEMTDKIREGTIRHLKELAMLHDDGINSRYRMRTFDGYEVTSQQQKKAKEYAMRYANAFAGIKDREKNSLFFHGGCGCGKTHLACAIANDLRDKGVKCNFTTFEDMLLKIRDSYDKQGVSDMSIRNLYKDADLLILDDLAKEKATEFSTSVLFDIVNHRYENILPMIVTANHDRDSLIKRLTPADGDGTKADAVVSRLYEMCVAIPMDGIADYRRKK